MKSRISNKRIIDSLVKNSYLSNEDLLSISKKVPEDSILDSLIFEKKLTKDLIGQAIAESLKLTYYDLNSNLVESTSLLTISAENAQNLRIIVLKIDGKSINITTDDDSKFDDIKTFLKENFPDKKINIYYSLTEDVEEVFLRYRADLQKRVDNIFNEGVDFANKFFEEIVNDAVDNRASDIHFEPLSDNVLIKFRIDGLLKEEVLIAKDYYENILNRIKVLSNIRIDQKFRTQDGAIRIKIKDYTLDLRISIIPIVDGQKVVIRILSNYIKNLSLEDLGLSEENLNILKKVYKNSVGMILTTGPTGSGKTTTLYSIVKNILRPEINVTTIEDPVEYRMPGVNQIQVNEANNITFAKGLRSIVRQDPNVILVGEIRDRETAEIAINAALTGHLLLSTFHANDAASSIPRLIDMGIEPFLLASTLNVIIAQRLCRKTCESCKLSKEYSITDLKNLNVDEYFKTKDKLRLYTSKGCQKCNFTGYKGRMGLFELIYVTEEIQSLIMKRSSSNEILKTARSQGSKSFFEDGLEKVMNGVVSLEEMLRVASPPEELKR